MKEEIISYILFVLLGFILGRMSVRSIYMNINTPQEVKTQKPSILEVFKKHEESVEEKQKERELTTMLENINNYDGSSYGQKDV